MNQTQISICLNILKHIKTRPISNLFLGTPEFPCDPPMEHPSTLQSMTIKLQRGLYQSPLQWKVEMQQLFNAFTKQPEKDPIRAASAEQLLGEFQQLYSYCNPEMKGMSLKLGLLSSEFEDYIVRNKNMIKTEVREGNPSAKLFETRCEDIDIKQLAREIKLLHSPNLKLDVASYVYKTQPECLHMEGELTIEFELMNEETLAGTKKVVRSLLHDAAIGKIDPYKSTLQNMQPIKLKA